MKPCTEKTFQMVCTGETRWQDKGNESQVEHMSKKTGSKGSEGAWLRSGSSSMKTGFQPAYFVTLEIFKSILIDVEIIQSHFSRFKYEYGPLLK